jgi:hypothetical protein
MQDRILNQAESIRRNWGEDAAQRYLARYQQQPIQSDLRGDRWMSNDRHQPRRFGDLAAAMIEVQAQAQSYRAIAGEYGCCIGTISNVRRRRGSYKK